jgi:aminopeptidase N
MLVREGGLGTSSTAGERMRLDPSAYQTGSESLIHGGVRAARDTATSGAAYCTRGVVAVAASTVVVVVVTVTLLVVLLHPATKHICPPNSYRLPTTVLPESYSISWNPLFSAPFTFSGSTNVSVRAQSAVGCVVLHAEGLDFVEGVWLYFGVTGEDGSLDPAATATAKQLVKLSSLLRYEDEQMIGIPLTTKIAEGERIVLAFKFKSTLGQDMTGLYVSSYNETDSKGATKLKYMVSSQFESTYARHAFPCFDEPAMKANFTVAVQNVNTGQVCLSNMPESAASLRAGNGAVGFPRTCTFDTSIRMSTYLVTVVIGELYSVQGVTSSGTQVRVWATKNDAGNLDFALGVVLDVLPYFERLFDVPFPIPKLDYAAIPDFAAGTVGEEFFRGACGRVGELFPLFPPSSYAWKVLWRALDW